VKGTHKSTRSIGLFYQEVHSVKINYEKLSNYFQQLYSNGNLEANLGLAYMYTFGMFLQRDENKAFDLAMGATAQSYNKLYKNRFG
jgi:TPR repeat protein